MNKESKTVSSNTSSNYQYRVLSILQLLATQSINIKDIMPIDDPKYCCLTRYLDSPGSPKNPESPKEQNICSGVGNVKPLGPKGKVGIPYLVMNKQGKKLILKVSDVPKLSIDIDRTFHQLIGEDDQIKTCIANDDILKNLIYIGLDEFTNETMIGYIINFTFKQFKMTDIGLDLFVMYFLGFACSKPSKSPSLYSSAMMSGCHIQEYADLGTLSDISQNKDFMNGEILREDVVLEIIKQIIVALDFLQKTIYFSSGDLKADNILVKRETVRVSYEGIKMNAQFKIKIADFGKSSCIVKTQSGKLLRFYNKNSLADAYLKIFPFTPHITSYNHGGELVYIINNTFISQFYTRSRHMGTPFYGTFDIYTIFISLSLNPSYRHTLWGSLRALIWNQLWIDPSDQKIVESRILKESGSRSITKAIEVLMGIKLRCLIMGKLISSLKTQG